MKKFIIKTFLVSLPIFCIIAYYVICVKPHKNGDLGELGFIPFDDEYDSLVISDSLDSDRVIKIDDIEQIENPDSAILTIGDSFSQQGKFGYQNYLAQLYPDYKVYNLCLDGTYKNFPYFQNLLLGNKKLPTIIILESVERHFVERIADMDFKEMQKIENDNNTAEEVSNDSSFFQTIKNIYHKFSDDVLETQEFTKKWCDIQNPVKHVKLNRTVFTCKNAEKDLFFYQDDIIPVTENNVYKSKENLALMYKLIKRKGIRFVFLVASDKYDLYKPYIDNDPYMITGRLDYFPEFSKDNKFLNSKELLAPYVKSGVLDMYKCDDTHWSIRAAKIVADNIKVKLELQSNIPH